MDISGLARAIEALAEQIADLRRELSEIKQISSLTYKSLKSYYADVQGFDQEINPETGLAIPKPESSDGKNKNNPPLVPEGTRLTCIRCNYQWTPRARRPHLCPRCKTPWWFPPKWKWRPDRRQRKRSPTNDMFGGTGG